MKNDVIFSFYNKKNPNGYKCTNYRMPPGVFYKLLKENKKDYLKLFSGKPDQIMNYLDKIDRVEKKREMISINLFVLL